MRKNTTIWLFGAILLTVLQVGWAETPGKKPDFFLRDYSWMLRRFGSELDYWNFLKEQGYNGLDLEIVDPDGGIHFFSPTMEKASFYQHTDSLSDLLKVLDTEESPFKRNEARISLNFSELSRQTHLSFSDRRFRPLSRRKMGKFVLELQKNYVFTDLTSEPFSEEIQTILRLSLDPTFGNLNMVVLSPHFERYLYSLIHEDANLDRAPDGWIIYDTAFYPLGPSDRAPPTMGLGDVAHAIAKSFHKKVWYGAGSGEELPPRIEHNLFLYRTLQYAPDAYLMMPKGEDPYIYDPQKFHFGREIKPDIQKFYKPGLEKGKKPVANLVLGSHSETELTLPQFIEPIMNALLANGYEVKVTFSSLMEEADLYYVVGGDDWLDELAFFDDLIELIDYRNSRFYGKVILHPMGEILNKSRWKKIRKLFMIPETEIGWIPDLPPGVRKKDKTIRWKGRVPSDHYGMTFLRSGKIHANHGDVVLSEILEGETLALVLKFGNHFLINGNLLHLEAGFFISLMLKQALESPALAYVTSGRDRTAALALEETDLKLKIPALDTPPSWHLFLYDSGGSLIEDKIIKAGKKFEKRLKPYQLLVLESLWE